MKKSDLLPEAKPFVDFSYEDGEKDVDFGDDGLEVEKIISGLDADFTLLRVLSNLEDRLKTVLLLMILKDLGYNITDEECAKVMSVSRVTYSKWVKSIKVKSAKLLQEGAI